MSWSSGITLNAYSYEDLLEVCKAHNPNATLDDLKGLAVRGTLILQYREGNKDEGTHTHEGQRWKRDFAVCTADYCGQSDSAALCDY